MRLFHSKTHAVLTTLLLCTFAVIDAFPVYGPPFFRYTGSDPKHLVWNLGWPLPWVIYDAYNPPYWFAILGAEPLRLL